MTEEEKFVDAALRSWKANADRVEAFFHALSDEQLEQEIAPGRNRLIYLWGHLASVSDGMLPLLGIGPRLHPQLDAMFLSNPDRSGVALLSAAELKHAAAEIDRALWDAFNNWSPSEWLAKHSAVSDDDFVKEPHRNRFNVLLSRTAHMAFHYGQAILVKPRT